MLPKRLYPVHLVTFVMVLLRMSATVRNTHAEPSKFLYINWSRPSVSGAFSHIVKNPVSCIAISIKIEYGTWCAFDVKNQASAGQSNSETIVPLPGLMPTP